MVCKLVHPSKADESTDLVPEGIFMVDSPVHPAKHLAPMVLTDDGVVILPNEEQL